MQTLVITANPPYAVLCDQSFKGTFPPRLLHILSGDKLKSIPVVAGNSALFRTGCVAFVGEAQHTFFTGKACSLSKHSCSVYVLLSLNCGSAEKSLLCIDVKLSLF